MGIGISLIGIRLEIHFADVGGYGAGWVRSTADGEFRGGKGLWGKGKWVRGKMKGVGGESGLRTVPQRKE